MFACFSVMFLSALLRCSSAAVAEGTNSDLLIMENEHLKIAVCPKMGGTVYSFVDKAAGWDYVGGAGKPDGGWGEYNVTTFFPESEINTFKYMPYEAKAENGQGFKRIIVTMAADGLKITRTMTLRDGSREFEVRQKWEVLDKPRRLWLRWHPWIKCGKDEETAVLIPGPDNCIRKVNASYFLDNYMRPDLGCMIVANTTTGNGLWMTFERDNVPWVMTWCYGKGRGIGPEILGRAYLGQPGETLENKLTYFAFTPKDKSGEFPTGVIKDGKEIKAARDFAELVRPHLAQIGPHEMWKKFPHQCYGNSYLRPDMPAFYDWGYAECMFESPGAQDGSIRARFIAQTYPGKKAKVSGRISIIDLDGKLVRQAEFGVKKEEQPDPDKKEKAWPEGTSIPLYALDAKPVETNTEKVALDGATTNQFRWDRIAYCPLAGIPDGEYLIKAEVCGADGKTLYEESRNERFMAELGLRMAKQLEKEGDPSFRPFIVALADKGGEIKDGVARVSIGVEEAGGVARKGWPVCAVLALPEGSFKPGVKVSLLSPSGTETPVDVEPATTWPDGSAKWFHLFFNADIPANGFAFYTAVVGNAPEKQAGQLSPLVTEDEEAFTMRTGKLQVVVSRKGEKGIGRVSVDGKEVLLDGNAGDIWWEDGKGRIYSFTADECSCVRNRPNAAVILLKGRYTNPEGETKCFGELRIEAARNSAAIRVLHTVIFAGDPYLDRLASFGMKLQTPAGKYSKAVALMDGSKETGGKNLSLFQETADRCSISGLKPEKGRVDGAILFQGDDIPALGIYAREFWRNYPEKAEVNTEKGEIILSHWPKEAGVFDLLPPERYYTACSSSPQACATGMSKTHEVILDWSGLRSPASVLATHGEPVIAIAAPKWNCATKALGMLSAFNPKVLPEVEQRIHRVWQLLERHRELFGMFGEWPNGNHRNAWWPWDKSARYSYHGRSVWLSNEDHHSDSAWYLYARSGDRLFLKDAMGNTRAIRDVATSQYSPAWPEVVGGSARHHYTIWLGMGDYGHSMLEGFVMDWALTGDSRSWQMAKLQADFFLRQRKGGGEWRYLSSPLSGLSRMYLETGDMKFKDKADWIATTFAAKEHRLFGGEYNTGDSYFTYGSEAMRWYSRISPEARKIFVDGVQGTGAKDTPKFNGLGEIGEVWEITGDPKLAQQAYKQGMGLVNDEDRSFDPRFRGISRGCDLQVHVHMRRALALARAKEAMIAGEAAKQKAK